MTEEREIIGSADARELLGVSESTLYRMVREQGLPCRKIGKPGSKHPTLLFSRTAIIEWVRRGDSAA